MCANVVLLAPMLVLAFTTVLGSTPLLFSKMSTKKAMCDFSIGSVGMANAVVFNQSDLETLTSVLLCDVV